LHRYCAGYPLSSFHGLPPWIMLPVKHDILPRPPAAEDHAASRVLKHSRMLLERGSIVILSADALAEITSTVDNK
jgi:hypothetical protein